ncbi:MAG: prephenate dehydrogenase/arogenate dehydrogenase family protein [Kiritimatiellae bacterium]|nr:prephenate dehydrogenase/arogenate dehydrogenase family protein [Kiritimatiellia bacterium]
MSGGDFAETAVRPRRIGVLGTGLIGGSLLLALRRLLPNAELRAGAPSETTRAALVARKAADVVFDPGKTPAPEALSGCDLAILAAPPAAVVETLPSLKGADIGLVVDVCSVKCEIMAAAQGLGNFLGGHPMAGTENAGFAAADADLFRNAAFIVCKPPDFSVPAPVFESFLGLVADLGMRAFEMTAEEHDRRLAMISHLPHVAAFALSLCAAETGDPVLKNLVGGGFRDTTRIAASSPELWADILRASPSLPRVIDDYIGALARLRGAIAAPRGDRRQDDLQTLLAAAESYRRTIPEGLNRRRR